MISSGTSVKARINLFEGTPNLPLALKPANPEMPKEETQLEEANFEGFDALSSIIHIIQLEIFEKELELVNQLLKKEPKERNFKALTKELIAQLAIMRTGYLKECDALLSQPSVVDIKSAHEVSDEKEKLKSSLQERIKQVFDQAIKGMQISAKTDLAGLKTELEKKIFSALNRIANEYENIDGELKSDVYEILPFYLPSSLEISETANILEILNHPHEFKPSHLANVQVMKTASETIRRIDEAFLLAVNDYRFSFIKANIEDVKASQKPRDDSLDFSLSIATGAARFALKTPDIPVIKHIAGPFLGVAGCIYGMCNKNNFTQEKINEERSQHRCQWLKAVLIQEELRSQQAIDEITQKAEGLKKQIDQEKYNYLGMTN